MKVNRRTFLSQSALLSGSLLFKDDLSEGKNKPPFNIPADFSLKILASKWGFSGTWNQLCARAKEIGYEGIEVRLPWQKKEQDVLFNAIEKHQLEYAFLVGFGDSNFDRHLEKFQKAVEAAVAFKPLLVNCHTGRDYFSFEQNKQFIDFTTQLTKSTGVNIYHETHRSRMLFAAHVTKNFLEQLQGLHLTLDISHWCNVHESLLHDQQEAVKLALSRTGHVHGRVGHAESPQITDPRAPEWKREVNTHFQWWDSVVKNKIDAGQPLSMTAEFGPPNYMSTVPYTRQPLADQWDVNAYMMRLWKERYS